MEAWKRTYSNSDTKTVAMPYFWENFDKENYSIWHCEYKYPEELKMIFMSCNLITGNLTTCFEDVLAIIAFKLSLLIYSLYRLLTLKYM